LRGGESIDKVWKNSALSFGEGGERIKLGSGEGIPLCIPDAEEVGTSTNPSASRGAVSDAIEGVVIAPLC
jgi:hypothetical protein